MALLGAGLTVAGCCATGLLLLRKLRITLASFERLPLAFLLGAAIVHLEVFLALSAHLAYWPILLLLLLSPFLFRGQSTEPATQPPNSPDEWRKKFGDCVARPRNWVGVVIWGLFFWIYFLNAWAPERSPDGSSYHLGIVARYVRAHAFIPITTNMYSTLSGGVDMLFVPAFAIGRHSAAALVHFAFLIALAALLFAYGKRIGNAWAGAGGALLVFVSPVVGVDASSAYVDVAVAAVVFGVFYMLDLWDSQKNSSYLIPIGILAGYACAAKYTAFVAVLAAVGFLLLRRGQVISVLSLSALIVSPWIIKNWIIIGNPLAPFGNALFRNPNIHVLMEREWAAWLRTYDVKPYWELLLEVTVRGARVSGHLGPIFLAAPIGLLALRSKPGRRLLAFGVIMLLPYFLNVGTRFLIPCLPFFAMAMALVLCQMPWLLEAVLVAHAVLSWPTIVKRYAPYSWRVEHSYLKQALRIEPPDQYLRRVSSGYQVARLIETRVPAGGRVFAINGAADAYTTREILVGYEGALNELFQDWFFSAWQEDSQPKVLQTFHFPERPVRKLRVWQAAHGGPGEQWNIHELRLLDRGQEVDRQPDWKLTSKPNRWEIQLAFDNSPITRWRSWEVIAPGMYVEIDLPTAQILDELTLETSYQVNQIQLELQVSEDGSNWTTIARNPAVTAQTVRANLRRGATYEMHARGVSHMLLWDGDYGANDVRDDPETWGVRLVGEAAGARLYEILP